jgi:prepilin-type N-terminal cleavage/methylation domain-containing protein
MTARPPNRRAVTLVELLMVAAILAIIAILGATQYQLASARSRVGRAMADMAVVRNAIEMYRADENDIPALEGGVALTGALELLLRPKAYLPSLPADPFSAAHTGYQYLGVARNAGLPSPAFGRWALFSPGPNRIHETFFSKATPYDPTNGLASDGDIILSESPIAYAGDAKG